MPFFFLSPPTTPFRVAEKEPINKMSLHNLATVFGPTLLRPSEVESKAHLTSAADIWSHDVMAQVPLARPGLLGSRHGLPHRAEREQLGVPRPVPAELLGGWSVGCHRGGRAPDSPASETKTKQKKREPGPGAPGADCSPGWECRSLGRQAQGRGDLWGPCPPVWKL